MTLSWIHAGRRWALALGLLLGASAAQAALPTLCVWDPIGRGGQIFGVARNYSWAMEAKGFKFQLRAYADEAVAVEDFKVGQCDGLMATTMRTKTWVALPAAIDYPGAATVVRDGKIDVKASYEVVRRSVKALADPVAQKLTVQGRHEVAGIIPAGPTYLMMRDRQVLQRGLAGARMPAFDNDKLMLYMIAKAGGVPVSVNTRSFGTAFNNGHLDVIFAPAVAFKALELHKGIGTKGGVSRFPLSFATLQVLVLSDKFPAGFGLASRQYWSEMFNTLVIGAERAEAAIPAGLWVDYEGDAGLQFVTLQRDARVEAAKAGYFSKLGLKFMKRVRCGVHPGAPDCASPLEIQW